MRSCGSRCIWTIVHVPKDISIPSKVKGCSRCLVDHYCCHVDGLHGALWHLVRVDIFELYQMSQRFNLSKLDHFTILESSPSASPCSYLSHHQISHKAYPQSSEIAKDLSLEQDVVELWVGSRRPERVNIQKPREWRIGTWKAGKTLSWIVFGFWMSWLFIF